MQSYPGKAQRYRIRSVPTFVLIENGEEVRRRSGLTSRNAIAGMFAPKLFSF